MSLEAKRKQLIERLKLGTAFKPANIPMTLKIAADWWLLYKAWEAADKFLPAFREGRMSVRQIPVPQELRGRGISELGKYDITYGNYKDKLGEVNFNAQHGTVKQTYPEERYRVGTKAMKQRMNPANFGMDGGERLKYKRGLHDMSASLLSPTITKISLQVRWKFGELGTRVTVFMPLPLEQDLYCFSLLNAYAKAERAISPMAYETIANMRKRMTRVKLADAEDIGAGLRDISPIDSTSPKFRYGMKGNPEDAVRMQKALNYTSILPRATPVAAPVVSQPVVTVGSPGGVPGPPGPPPGMLASKTAKSNEIVIAYREHAGDRFPLFTKFDTVAKQFVCHPDEPGSNYILNQVIHDEWAQTRES